MVDVCGFFFLLNPVCKSLEHYFRSRENNGTQVGAVHSGDTLRSISYACIRRVQMLVQPPDLWTSRVESQRIRQRGLTRLHASLPDLKEQPENQITHHQIPLFLRLWEYPLQSRPKRVDPTVCDPRRIALKSVFVAHTVKRKKEYKLLQNSLLYSYA